jgi:hypothetical protein
VKTHLRYPYGSRSCSAYTVFRGGDRSTLAVG